MYKSFSTVWRDHELRKQHGVPLIEINGIVVGSYFYDIYFTAFGMLTRVNDEDLLTVKVYKRKIKSITEAHSTFSDGKWIWLTYEDEEGNDAGSGVYNQASMVSSMEEVKLLVDYAKSRAILDAQVQKAKADKLLQRVQDEEIKIEVLLTSNLLPE